MRNRYRGHKSRQIDVSAARRPGEHRVVALHRTQCLLQRLGEISADRHRLTNGLHCRSEHWIGLGELLEGEPWNLHHDVVQRRLKGCGGLRRDVIGNLVQRVTDRQLGGDLRDGEPGGLRRQRRRARNPRVHLDDDQAPIVGIDRELDVAAAGVDTDSTNDVDREVAHPLVLAVGEGEGWSHRDGVAGVDTHGVEVLDRTDDHDVVVPIPHEFEFVFLPAEDRFFQQHLARRAGLQAVAGDESQVRLVVRHA